MYSDLYSKNWNQIFQYRLDAIRQKISSLQYPTKEEYQADVVSMLNTLIRFQDQMQPLLGITRETPALIGSIQDNLDLLNGDVSAIAAQLLDTEQTAAGLLNLYAATQISLRQRLRQMLYASTSTNFWQPFVGGDLIDQHTCDVDLNAGIVSLPVASQVMQTLTSVRIGPTSVGTLLATSSLTNLIDNQPQTVFEWEGTRLELIFEFPVGTILNRMSIESHDYAGVIVEEISCSPDGVYHEDALEEVPSNFLTVDASSNKFSGQYVVDFTPKETAYLKLVLIDCVGAKSINLRGISFFTRQFSNTGYVNFTPVQLQAGDYQFDASALTTDQLTTIQHQTSDDGAKYRVIYPGTVLPVKGTFWYRVFFQRNDQDFAQDQNPFVSGVQDLASGPSFTATAPSVTTDLGGGIYQREVPLDTVAGPIRIKDRCVEGTMQVSVAGAALAAGDFSFNTGILTLKSLPVSTVVLRYQTSLAGQQNFNARKPYYSPYLYEAKFTKQQ